MKTDRIKQLILYCAVSTLISITCYSSYGYSSANLRIAVIPKGSSQIFWNSVHDGVTKAAAEENANIIWRSPAVEEDKDDQKKIIQDCIREKVDAIVLAPIDYGTLVESVKDAKARGINTVIIDSALNSDDYISCISTDNYNSGKLCAQSLCSAIGDSGDVIMMRFNRGSVSTAEREQGFMDEIVKHPKVKLLSSDQYGGATVESCFKMASRLLYEYKDVDGIFCPNEMTTSGMLKALQYSGRAGKIKFAGFDLSYALREALARGEITSLALQDPLKMGYIGVKTAVKSLEGKPVEKRIDTGVKILTTKMLNDESLTSRILYSK